MWADLMEELKCILKASNAEMLGTVLEQQRSLMSIHEANLQKIVAGTAGAKSVTTVATRNPSVSTALVSPTHRDASFDSADSQSPSTPKRSARGEARRSRISTFDIPVTLNQGGEEPETAGEASSDPSTAKQKLSVGRGATWISELHEIGGQLSEKATLYNETGFCVRVANTVAFHAISLMMICANALYIGIEADWNESVSLNEAEWQYQVCDHVFCIFFTVEIIIRFGTFRKKRDCFRDNWFLLDFVMVILMVCETWILNIILTFVESPPNTGAFGGIGRMLRLLRLTRISKLMQIVPELVTMVKGMIAAIRAVHAALIILILLVYVFAIIMNALIADDPSVSDYFPTVRSAMMTLIVQGVLLDDISTLTYSLLETRNPIAVVFFAVFILLSALTVMNMLIGVLCQVVLDVSAEEKENNIKDKMKKTLLVMLQTLDADHSGQLSKEEVQAVICEPAAVSIMNDIQVDTEHLLDLTEMLYPTEDSTLPISVIMNIVLSLRGKRPPTMNDLARGNNFLLWALETQLAEHRSSVTQEIQGVLMASQTTQSQQNEYFEKLHRVMTEHSTALKNHHELLYSHHGKLAQYESGPFK